MKLNKGYKLLISPEYLDWYEMDTPDNPPENRTHYLYKDDIVQIVKRESDTEWEFGTLDDRVRAIAPIQIVEQMRRAYLKRQK